MNVEARTIQALLRNDFLTFVERVFMELNPGRTFRRSWYHEAIAYAVEVSAVTREIDRMVINLPPRSAKSTIASVALPAYLLGRDPTCRIIVVSYNQDLADMLGRQTRQVMQAPWYVALFPSTRIPQRAAANQFYTTRGGFRLATSTRGTLTGRGGDVIIIDDPLKAIDALSESARDAALEWATTTLFTRIDEKTNGAILLVQQRQHEKDLAGRMLESMCWGHLSLPAIAEADELITIGRNPMRHHQRLKGDLLDPIREPQSVLDGLLREMGSSAFAAQYQQAPLPPDGDMIKLSWFGTYDDLPSGGQRIFSIDTASKGGLRNDWSVCEVWRQIDGRLLLEYVWRRQVEYPELKRSIVALALDMQPDTILIEDKGQGIGLIQDLKADYPSLPVIPYDPGRFDKVARMQVQSAKIEAGQVLLPSAAPWLQAFTEEVRRFPNGSHDDQIDATAQVLDWTSTRHTGDLFIMKYRT